MRTKEYNSISNHETCYNQRVILGYMQRFCPCQFPGLNLFNISVFEAFSFEIIHLRQVITAKELFHERENPPYSTRTSSSPSHGWNDLTFK